jgi:hypothetical protein
MDCAPVRVGARAVWDAGTPDQAAQAAAEKLAVHKGSQRKSQRRPCRPLAHQRFFAALSMTRRSDVFPACHEKVTGTCHSERSEESEVGHAARLVRPDASLPLSMTREGAFFTACRMLAPYAGLPDSSYTTRQRRPAARGGPTLDGRLVPLVERSSLVGPPLAAGLRCRPVTGSQHAIGDCR